MASHAELQDLLFCSSLKPVFMAIDFEGTEDIKRNFKTGSDTRVGISILDSRDLKKSSGKQELTILISSFVTGTEKYYESSTKRCMFGTTEKISTNEMLATIEKHTPRDREIVLVGNSTNSDLQVLKSLDSNLRASAVAVFDAHKLAVDHGLGSLSLKRLLEALKCPRGRFHNAANDANCWFHRGDCMQ